MWGETTQSYEFTTTYKKPDKKGYWRKGEYILRKPSKKKKTLTNTPLKTTHI